MVFLQLPTFTEFAQDTPRLGDLLRTRYAETRVTPDLQGLLATYPDILHIVALVTEEDPDTLAVAPIVARLFDGVARCDLRICRDDGDLTGLKVLARDLDLVAALEEWDLPQFLIFDEEWELVGQWGPRPAAAEARLDAWLGKHPEYEALGEEETPAAQQRYAAWAQELTYEMRTWYNSGLTKACLDEWRDLLISLQGNEETNGAGRNE